MHHGGRGVAFQCYLPCASCTCGCGTHVVDVVVTIMVVAGLGALLAAGAARFWYGLEVPVQEELVELVVDFVRQTLRRRPLVPECRATLVETYRPR